ncbi:MAG: NUDIX domain-containing protein [Chloroflexota bacterium]
MLINCIKLDGSIIQVPQNELVFRPAVFAIIVHQQKLLTLNLKATGKYHLPGGGIELGETMEETLKREVLEETGILIKVGQQAFIEELFFYYDPSQTAYHGIHIYMHAKPHSTQLLVDTEVTDGSAEKPRWVPINSLQDGLFQSAGAGILDSVSDF